MSGSVISGIFFIHSILIFCHLIGQKKMKVIWSTFLLNCQQLNVIVLVINRGIKVISVLISDPLPRSYGVCKAYTCIQCIYMWLVKFTFMFWFTGKYWSGMALWEKLLILSLEHIVEYYPQGKFLRIMFLSLFSHVWSVRDHHSCLYNSDSYKYIYLAT